jgi:hypothetical protein
VGNMADLRNIIDIYQANLYYQSLINKNDFDLNVLFYGLSNVVADVFLDPNITGIQGMTGLIALFNSHQNIENIILIARKRYNRYLLNLINVTDIENLNSTELNAVSIKSTWLLSEQYHKKYQRERVIKK